MTIDVKFFDSGCTSQEATNPKYPNGVRIDLTKNPLLASCTRNLPYPAPRVGTYAVQCLKCNWMGVVTVAGRADDPTMITIPCKLKGLN